MVDFPVASFPERKNTPKRFEMKDNINKGRVTFIF
jgi:hypothetical protein